MEKRRSFGTILLLAAAGLVPVAATVVVLFLLSPRKSRLLPGAEPPAIPQETFEQRSLSLFTAAPANPYRLPRVERVPLPDFPGACAVWGSTGRDARGHVWFGVSAAGTLVPSARLYEYVPETRTLFDRGGVVEQLRQAGIWRDSEGQMKIHSRIVQGADSYLYFASMDEQGEDEDGTKLPTWGSHLWRIDPETHKWEHLLAAPEGLIAVAGMGRHIFALGYFGHVLYHFDCRTKAIHSVTVGSLGGHISRHFLADDRGHAYVPRLRRADTSLEPVVTLAEFDSTLKEIKETPLKHYYSVGPLAHNHGIVGFQYLADRSLVFVTSLGFLYQVRPPFDDGPAAVSELGWLNSSGPVYAPVLFSYDGQRYVLSLTCESPEQWVVFDLDTRKSQAIPLDMAAGQNDVGGRVLYGSLTRDNAGAFYVVGTAAANDEPGRNKPVVFRLLPEK
jgi:hypothetical protein